MCTVDIKNFYPSISKDTLQKSLSKQHDANLIDFSNFCNDFLNTLKEEGLPQGANVFHLLADTVLAMVDEQLQQKIKDFNIEDYRILRYRDDYRIFANRQKDCDIILTLLKETLYSFSLSVNEQKTGIHEDIISNSIKQDKQDWTLFEALFQNNTQIPVYKMLLLIKKFSQQHPNTGSVQRGLDAVYQKLMQTDEQNTIKSQVTEIIALILDIVKTNQRWVAKCLQIIDCLVPYIKKKSYQPLSEIIHKKLIRQDTDFMVKLWVQCFIVQFDKDFFGLNFNNPLSSYLTHQDIYKLWDFSFIENKSIHQILNETSIIDFVLVDDNELFADKAINLFYKYTEAELKAQILKALDF